MTHDTKDSNPSSSDWGFDDTNFWSLAGRLVPCGPADVLTAVDLKHRLLWWSHQDQRWNWVPRKEYPARFAEIAAWHSIAPGAADAITKLLRCEKGDPEGVRHFTRMMTIQDTFTTMQGYRCAWEGGWLYRSLLLDHRWLLHGFALPAFDEYIFLAMNITGWGGPPSECIVSFLQRDPVIAAMPAMYELVFPLSWKTGILLMLKQRSVSATVADIDQGIERAAAQGQFTLQQMKDLRAHHSHLIGKPGQDTTEAVMREVMFALLDAPEPYRPAIPFVMPTLDPPLSGCRCSSQPGWMSTGSDGSGPVWSAVLERFERHAPASVMARLALEHALPAGWVDDVFEAHRQQQYSRELLFSTVVELTTLVSLGLRPSLHAAARQMPALPVSLGSLYDKVNHTEPGVLRALVRGSAERLGPVMAAVGHDAGSLPGWRLRVLDGNHLPASEKRLLPLREFRGAALPGQSLVVYDPDLGLVVDLVACEDAHASERAAVAPLLDGAQPGELWIADRHYCTRTVLGGLEDAGACFIVREHGRHPRLAGQGEWRACGRVETGLVREQTVKVQGQAASWRRVELTLDQPTEDGDTTIRLWSNLPEAVGAQRIAELYRTRWQIEGMFGRLEAVLHSEVSSLGHPRAALLGFAAAVLAYNVLALLQRAVKQAHQPPATPSAPPLEVSCFHLAVQVRSGYEGLLIALPPEHWPRWNGADPAGLAQHLLRLARTINPRQVATSKRKPKTAKPKGYVDGKTARTHVATARLLATAKATP